MSTTPSIPASTTPVTPTRLFGEPKEYVVPRKGDRDLAFKGWRIGNAEEKNAYSEESGVEVSVYLTEGNALITDVRRWSEDYEEHSAGVHCSADDAVQWLKNDDKGRLGTVSKSAWVAACEFLPDMKGKDVERVD